jgi:hypothetical protein
MIGSIDEPGSYFAGDLPMRWGPYGSTKLLYFGGRTETTTFGLGGSIENLFGSVGMAVVEPHSAMPMLLHALRAEGGTEIHLSQEMDSDWELRAVEVSTGNQQGPTQQVEFIAKRLMWGDDPSQEADSPQRILLGTPLYVALGD